MALFITPSPQTVGTKVGHRVGADSIDQEHGLSFVLHVTKPTFHCSLPIAHRWSFPCRALIKITVPTVCFPQGLCVYTRTHTNSHTFHMCVCIIHLHIYIYFTCTNIHIHTDRYIHIYSHSCAHIYILTCTQMHVQTNTFLHK